MNDTTVWCQNASVTEPQREVVPKRLREQLLRQRTKVKNQAEPVPHQRFCQNAEHKKGTDMKTVSDEGVR